MFIKKPLIIWDLPTRLFHWILTLLFIGAILTAKLGWMTQHAIIGINLGGLLLFRILWGFFGSDTAKFSFFIKGPITIIRYLQGKHDFLGHNPLGGLMVVLLILLLSLQIILGLFSNDNILFEAPLTQFISHELSNICTKWHYRISNILIGLVSIHISVVLWHLLFKKENLIMPMIYGWKYVTQIPAKLPFFASLKRALIFLLFSIILIIYLLNL